MATVTTYPGCPCCDDDPSGSGSGSGSGDGESGSGAVPRTPICFGRSVPTTLYVTFGGAMAGWGTLAYQFYAALIDGRRLWHYNGSPTAAPPQLGCFTALNSTIQFCGTLGAYTLADGELFLGWASPGGTCSLTAPGGGVVPVSSYDPFYATGGGTMGPFNCPPECAGLPYSFIVTETPP